MGELIETQWNNERESSAKGVFRWTPVSRSWGHREHCYLFIRLVEDEDLRGGKIDSGVTVGSNWHKGVCMSRKKWYLDSDISQFVWNTTHHSWDGSFGLRLHDQLITASKRHRSYLTVYIVKHQKKKLCPILKDQHICWHSSVLLVGKWLIFLLQTPRAKSPVNSVGFRRNYNSPVLLRRY